MNDEVRLRQHLQTNLSQLDWSSGLAKDMVLESLVGEPATQRTIARALADGVYFSPADLLAALPAGAWTEPPPAPQTRPEPDATRPIGSGQWRDASSDHKPDRTAMAVAIGAGVIALAGVTAWLGRRWLRK